MGAVKKGVQAVLVLGITGAIAYGIYHYASLPQAAGSSIPQQPSIVVVGAGLAGLTTAYRLISSGYSNVTLYEARSRVGGRVLSVKLSSPELGVCPHIAELGGNDICDGGKAEHMRALIAEMGLTLSVAARPLGCLRHIEQDTIINSSTALLQANIDTSSLHDRLERLRLTASNMEEVIREFFADNEVMYRTFNILVAEEEGAPITELSTECIDTFERFLLRDLRVVHTQVNGKEEYGEHVYLPQGNSSLTERLAERLGNKVHLGLPLVALSKDAQGRYLLTFGTGEQRTADIVVLAIPCSVYHDIAIDPSVIDHERLKHIQRVLYGQNAKIFVPLQEAYIHPSCYTNGRMVVYQTCCADVATLYYIHNYGYFTQETLAATLQQDISALRIAYNAQISLINPSIAQDKPFVSYSTAVGYSWPMDPYAQGSYSCIGAVQEKLFIDMKGYQGELVRTLFAPLNDTLFFAGEHATILLNIIGTMEAAVESGERTARMIVAAHPLTEKRPLEPLPVGGRTTSAALEQPSADLHDTDDGTDK